MIMESDIAFKFHQCTNTKCVVIILQQKLFPHNFLTTLHEYDADLSVSDQVLMTEDQTHSSR